MHFGLLYDFRNPPQWARPSADLYAALLEQIAFAEQLGFDDIWLTEHHFVNDGYLPSLLPMAAAVAARTQRVTIGFFVLLQPFHHPLRLAEDCAVVDIISNGRLLFGAGIGYRFPEFQSFGIDRRQRASITEESVEILIKCWSEEQFSYRGKHFQFENVRCTPKPVQRPHIPIWFGATQGEALRRTARLGDGLLHTNAAPPDAPFRYADALREYGKNWQQPRVATLRFVFTSDDPERDWDRLKAHALYQERAYASWYAEDPAWQKGSGAAAFGANSPTTYDDLKRLNHYFVGTPDQVIAEIKAFYDVAPFERFLFTPVWPGADPALGARSIQLFADKVMPALRHLDR